eukprot:m.117521 g.117521  ORF g.117521 m.117521 type:complete len:61 (+) comp15429_c0_seq3:1358-1540(+)
MTLNERDAVLLPPFFLVINGYVPVAEGELTLKRVAFNHMQEEDKRREGFGKPRSRNSKEQ